MYSSTKVLPQTAHGLQAAEASKPVLPRRLAAPQSHLTNIHACGGLIQADDPGVTSDDGHRHAELALVAAAVAAADAVGQLGQRHLLQQLLQAHQGRSAGMLGREVKPCMANGHHRRGHSGIRGAMPANAGQ